ncbi:MAG TPA: GntR family transcriptional regulator, partial [Paludibacter sp.]
RTYSILQDAGVIDNKRGIGFFVADNAVELIREKEKKEFFHNELPDFIRKVELLKLTEQDLSELLNLIKSNSK